MTASDDVSPPGGPSVAPPGRLTSHAGTAWVVLAAGMGTRMRSSHPKVLHPLCGRPMGAFFLQEARRWQPGQVVVVTGHQAARGEQELGAWAQRLGVAVRFVRQEPQRGTGDAVRRAMTALDPRVEEVAVSYADVPMLSAGTVVELVSQRRRRDAALAILTAVLDDPTGYGRVLRAPDEPDRVTGVVEERDASPEQRAIRETNAGVYAFRRDALEAALEARRPDNAQG
ncbi:MAG: NTP transferase domain-containing protein, partial [Firmicutes bacterium]|nr:NTP transferase domain-containing protein [Bacillota bacterium]